VQDADVVDLLDQIVQKNRSAHSLETQLLDFKSDGRSMKDLGADLAEASVCFANADGGTLIVGVRNTPGGREAIEGTQIDPDKLRSRIYDLTAPHLLVGVRLLEYEGSNIAVIEVPEGLEVYSTRQGAFRQRWNAECLPMSPADVSRLADERRGEDWSAAQGTAVIADIGIEAVKLARELLRNSRDAERQSLASRPVPELTRRLGLVHTDDRLTRAAEILLVDGAESAPTESVIYQHRRTAGGEADFSRRWSTPVVTTFAEVFETISARLSITPVNLSTGQQIALEDYPAAAVREALANALIHRDYRDREPVTITHSPEQMSILSPGPLVAGVTESNILIRGTKPRYPLLARACNELGLVEYLGLGVNRMFREMARAGRALPSLEAGRDAVRVTLQGGPPNIRVARLVADLPEELSQDTDALLTIVVLREKRTVSAKGLVQVLQKSANEIESVLRRMSASPHQLIEPSAATRSRRHPTYHLTGKVLSQLGPSVAYHTRTRSEVDRKVIEHIRDFDSINNSAVQRMLDVDVYTSRDILRDLVARELLVRTSTQARGPAVRYGRGPKFPGRRRTNVAKPPLPADTDGSEGLF
jgi:ATP-dependent DNA helicase RecG